MEKSKNQIESQIPYELIRTINKTMDMKPNMGYLSYQEFFFMKSQNNDIIVRKAVAFFANDYLFDIFHNCTAEEIAKSIYKDIIKD